MATFDPQVRRQSFGFFVNRILPRVQEKAYVDDGGDSDVDDWHHDANKKKQMAVEAYQDEKEMSKALGSALLTSGPANVFSLRLQQQDRRGGSIRDLVDPAHTSSRWQCLSSYWEIMNPWHADNNGREMVEKIVAVTGYSYEPGSHGASLRAHES